MTLIAMKNHSHKILIRFVNVLVKYVENVFCSIKGSLMWTQKVQLPMSYSSGTGYQLSAGHSSNVDGSIEIRRDHIKIDLEPVPSETEIFSIK